MITLTTGTLFQKNGVTLENDIHGAVISMNMDYLGNTVTFTLATGTVAAGNINIGVYGDRVELIVNLTTGAWTSSNGKSGTIAGAGLTNFLNQMKADRNLVEQFAAGASGIMPGTTTAW